MCAMAPWAPKHALPCLLLRQPGPCPPEGALATTNCLGTARWPLASTKHGMPRPALVHHRGGHRQDLAAHCWGPFPGRPRHQRAARPPTSSAQRTPFISAAVGAPAPAAASNAAPNRAVEAPRGCSALYVLDTLPNACTGRAHGSCAGYRVCALHAQDTMLVPPRGEPHGGLTPAYH